LHKEIAMRGLLTLIYGVAAYVAGIATLLYFIGFSANLLVPKSVDLGTSAPWVEALGTNLLLLILFGMQHSVMARRSFKQWWTHIVPPAVERSTFMVATCVVLALMFWFWTPIPAPVVWQVTPNAGVALVWSLFGFGWLLVLVSTFLIDHFELFGLKQVFARLKQRAPAETRFRTPLLYRFVRHPLYAGFLLTFWSVPTMTVGRLVFALGFTAYILIGIGFEERDLLLQFGERYRLYRKHVGMLIPKLRPPHVMAAAEFDPANKTAAAEIAADQTHIPSRDGRALIQAWYLAAKPRRAAVIFVHGEDGWCGDAWKAPPLSLARRLVSIGISVLMIRLRSHCSSSASLWSYGQSEHHDVLGAVDWLLDRGYPANAIGVLGASMGAASAGIATADAPIIPVRNGQSIAVACSGELWVTEDQGHLGSYRFAPQAYEEHIVRFFAHHLPGSASQAYDLAPHTFRDTYAYH
jgi:protein-S-isoprenylcysteine O-methyltransferase Ste14